jgi:dCMP deaminase
MDLEVRKSKWDARYLSVADLVATWSRDPNKQVGCVIVNDNQIVSTGYNGFPRGVNDSEHRLNDKSLKLQISLHGEENAVLFADRHDLKGATAYITHSPCSHCAARLIQVGIKRIVAKEKIFTGSWAASVQLARIIANEAGVQAARHDEGERAARRLLQAPGRVPIVRRQDGAHFGRHGDA